VQLRALRPLCTIVCVAAALTLPSTASAYNDGGYVCYIAGAEHPAWCYDSGASPHGYHNWTYGEDKNESATGHCNTLFVGAYSGNGSGYYSYVNTTSPVCPGGRLSAHWSNKEYPYIGMITEGTWGGRMWGWYSNEF